ncbi:hypothetical protein [Christiangramia sp.]|uniref:hypothetical protein n=1 Tax=Christiangramia sp. TaxID=1931228 RepID=UPI0026250ED4|nr:hypothetical protein [Christiangramia sp.]
MFKSEEIRWFFETENSSISKWFEENSYTFENTNPRKDYYLPLQKEDIGIKLREGNVEIKNRINRSEKEKFCKAEGYFESYIKWSFSSTEKDSLYEEIVEEEKYNWIGVSKERLSFKLNKDADKGFVKIKSDEFISSGCQIEYTRVKLKDDIWYTFGIECFGDKELKCGLSLIEEIIENAELKAENSMGYAEFLNRCL